jgi:hypothetical protein
MREELTFTAADCKPPTAEILKCQGIPADTKVDKRIEALIEGALTDYLRVAQPRALLLEVSAADFDKIYAGEGDNESFTPVAEIYPQAERLALFALTIGEEISARIEWLFGQNDFAQGSMLDSVASAGADQVADLVERYYLERVVGSDSPVALRFSPGYCGWHVSGQRRLFAALQPDSIGLTLRASHLMEPLKSISGVIIVGQPSIFEFEDSYDFCAACQDHSCQERQPTGLRTSGSRKT